MCVSNFKGISTVHVHSFNFTNKRKSLPKTQSGLYNLCNDELLLILKGTLIEKEDKNNESKKKVKVGDEFISQ